jgi:hypothetical protein
VKESFISLLVERDDEGYSGTSAGSAGGVSAGDGSVEGGTGRSVWEVVRHYVERRESYRVTAQEVYRETRMYTIY